MIQYDHSPVAAIGGLAVRGGLAEYAKKQQERAFDAARQEDQQNFQSAQAIFDAQRQAALQEQAARNQAMRDWQNNQAQAFQDAQRGAQHYWQQQQLNDRQREQQGAIDMRMQDRQNWDWQRQGAAGIEQSLMSQLSEFGKTKLTAGGQAKYRDMMKNLNAVQAMRATVPPEQYAAKLLEFSNRLNTSGLEADVMAAPEPVAKPLLDSDGKPTGSYTIMGPDGRFQVHEPRAEKEKAEQIDWSNPDAVDQRMNSRIWTDKKTGKRWYLDDKGSPSKPLDDSSGTDNPINVDDRALKDLKFEQEVFKSLWEAMPKVAETTGTGDQKVTKMVDPPPPSREAVQAEMQRRRQAVPEHKDVMQMREMLKSDPAAYQAFDALGPEGRMAQAKKARQILENEWLQRMGQPKQQDEGAFFQDTGPFFSGNQIQSPDVQEQLGGQPVPPQAAAPQAAPQAPPAPVPPQPSPLMQEYAAQFGMPSKERAQASVRELDTAQHNRLVIDEAVQIAELALKQLELKYGPDGPPAGSNDRIEWERGKRLIAKRKAPPAQKSVSAVPVTTASAPARPIVPQSGLEPLGF